MTLNLKKWQAAFAIGLCVGLANNAVAASFNVDPIGFNLISEQSSGVLRITNTGKDSVRIQVGAVDWSTDGHREILTDTDDLLLNPPIFSIEPGKTQYLRFGVRHPTSSEVEKTYRLLVDEVPSDKPQALGLKTLLRISIPVFIVPQEKQENLSWQLRREAAGPVLVAANDGNIHRKITRIQLSNVNSKDILQISTPTYVLPGQHKEWSLANGKIHAGKVRLHIQTDKGEIEEYLTLGADQVSSR